MSSLNYISPDVASAIVVEDVAVPVKMCRCRKKYCDLPYSRFSVKLKDIPWNSKAIPNTTSLPKLC